MSLCHADFIFGLVFQSDPIRDPIRDQAQGLFLKSPETFFGRISGDVVLFISSKPGRLEARNFAVIFTFIPFTTYEKTSCTE